MKITAVYYVENSGPFNTYVLDVCDLNDDRFVDDNKFEEILWKIFKEEQENEEYPNPSADVVFLYTEDFRSSNVAAQLHPPLENKNFW
jgi:hypothetical protein